MLYRHRMFLGLTFLVAIFGSSLPVQGESYIKGGRPELTLFVGPIIGDTFEDRTFGIPVDVGLEDSFTLGARMGVNMNSYFALEGSLAISPIDVIAKSGGRKVEVDTAAFFLHGNLVWHIVEVGPLVPFLTGGIGFMHLAVDEPGVKNETDLAINVGGGAKIFLDEKISLRLEVRDIITELEDTDEKLHLIEATAGVSFHF